ncbi:TPA: hypothetical protein ACH3X1_011576 [Trebouxia sp. C0004]
MISNILWSWAFVMDGRNNMQMSQPLRYDAAHPTVLQVHAWVTAMSLKSRTVQPWETHKCHPVVTVPVETSKRPQTRSLQMPSKRRSTTPAASKPALPTPFNKATAGRSNQKQQSLSVALHANASSLLPNQASPFQKALCPEPAAQQAASEFSIGNIHSVFAVGTSGPAFHARLYCLHCLAILGTRGSGNSSFLVDHEEDHVY